MAVNIDRVKGKTREARMTDEQVAKELGIHPSTYYRKLNADNGETFTVGQIGTLVELFKLTKDEAMDIFFADFLA